MKKDYKKPTMKVVEMRPARIICTSDSEPNGYPYDFD